MAFRWEFYPRAVLMLIKTTAGVLVLLALAACDPQRIAELEEGVSTEADVRARFGQLETIWDVVAGGRIFEYKRQAPARRPSELHDRHRARRQDDVVAAAAQRND